jgi:hypothetical protein
MGLGEVGSVMRGEMGARHPELSSEAVSALVDYYCFVWR